MIGNAFCGTVLAPRFCSDMAGVIARHPTPGRYPFGANRQVDYSHLSCFYRYLSPLDSRVDLIVELITEQSDLVMFVGEVLECQVVVGNTRMRLKLHPATKVARAEPGGEHLAVHAR